MPKVGKKQFSYTKAGKKAAKVYAKESGQSVEKYYGGGGVDPFSLKNPKGVLVEKALEAIEDQNAIPTTNAMNRSQTSQAGDEVGIGMYKEGGKVKSKKTNITDIVKDVKAIQPQFYRPPGTSNLMRKRIIEEKKKEILKGKKKK